MPLGLGLATASAVDKGQTEQKNECRKHYGKMLSDQNSKIRNQSARVPVSMVDLVRRFKLVRYLIARLCKVRKHCIVAADIRKTLAH
jgi:hypothetical protein